MKGAGRGAGEPPEAGWSHLGPYGYLAAVCLQAWAPGSFETDRPVLECSETLAAASCAQSDVLACGAGLARS